MCEFLVLFSDFVTFCAVCCCVIDSKRSDNGGLSEANFVKYMKCLTCIPKKYLTPPKCATDISQKIENHIDEYRLFSIRCFFLPCSIVVFGWNIAEFVLLHYDNENGTDFDNLTLYILIWISLIAMFLYLITLLIVSCTKELKNITSHQFMMTIYHLIDTMVDVTMIIATYESIHPGLNWRFAILFFSISDIVNSAVHFFVTLISFCISSNSRKNSVQPMNTNPRK